MRTELHRLRLWVRALRSLWRAYLFTRRTFRLPPRTNAQRRRLRRRREAMRLLGGACACCGLNLDFLPALTFHHADHTGAFHRRIAGALGFGIATHILAEQGSPPWPFTIEILCLNCHTMKHAEGRCAHRRRKALEWPAELVRVGER